MSARDLFNRFFPPSAEPVRTLACWRFPLILAGLSQLFRYAYLDIMTSRYLTEEGATAQQIAAEDAFIFRYRMIMLVVILAAGLICARFATRREMLVSAAILISAYLINDVWGFLSPTTHPKVFDDFIAFCYQWFMIPYWALRDHGMPRYLAILLTDIFFPLLFVPFARKRLPKEESL